MKDEQYSDIVDIAIKAQIELSNWANSIYEVSKTVFDDFRAKLFLPIYLEIFDSKYSDTLDEQNEFILSLD